jgi:hypothetical protein
VARRRNDFSVLEAVTEDLRLPSLTLDPPRVEGYAYRFTIVLPLLSAGGEVVFAPEHVADLHVLFTERFGGSLASSGVAHPSGTARTSPTRASRR